MGSVPGQLAPVAVHPCKGRLHCWHELIGLWCAPHMASRLSRPLFSLPRGAAEWSLALGSLGWRSSRCCYPLSQPGVPSNPSATRGDAGPPLIDRGPRDADSARQGGNAADQFDRPFERLVFESPDHVTELSDAY